MTEEDLNLVHSLAEKEGAVEAPTDLSLAETRQIELPDLEWRHYDNPPIKLVVTNTGHTVNVGGKWECNRSYIRDGPFKGNYVFAQMHFHWGPTDNTGSEHSVENRKLPLEMHVVHINRMYRSQETALKEKDGVAILAYLFEIQEEDNMDIEPIISALPLVSLPQTSTQISPVSIGSLLLQFQRDYLLYWGSVSSPSCQHVILWLTCRTPLGISSQQLAKFRQVRDVNGQFVVKNYRETHARRNHTLLHVSPSSKLESTLLSSYPGHAKVQEQLKQQEERLAEELRKTAAEEPEGAFIAEEPSESTEPLASLDAEAAAEAVSEAKAAEDAQAAAEDAQAAAEDAQAAADDAQAAADDAQAAADDAQAAAPSTSPSSIPETGQPASAPLTHLSGTSVAPPSTKPSGARVTAPSSGILPGQAAVQSGVPSVPQMSSTPTDAPAQEEFPERSTDVIPSQPSTMTTKLYGDASSTDAGLGVIEGNSSKTAPTGTETPHKTSATPSKTGSAVSKTPSKAVPSRTSSVRSAPMNGSKTPVPGVSRHSSMSKGFTSVTSKLSSEHVKGGVEGKEGEQPLRKNKTKSDLRVTLSETPMEPLPDEETEDAVNEKSDAETSPGLGDDAGHVCPPCPPCLTEVSAAAPSEVTPEVPYELPEESPSLLEEPAFEMTTEVPVEQSSDFKPEEPEEIPFEQPLGPQVEEETEPPCEGLPDLNPEGEAETPFEQLPEVQPQEPEDFLTEEAQEIPSVEELDTPYPEQGICPVEPGDIPSENPLEGPTELPEPPNKVSVCSPETLPGVPEAPADGSETTTQGPCPPCPTCPPCQPCPPCHKCGTNNTREEDQDSEMPPLDEDTAQGQGHTSDPTGKPTFQTDTSGECPPGFTKVKTISDAKNCPPGYKEVSAVAMKGKDECPPGYIPVSTYVPKDASAPITKPPSSVRGTPGRTRSSVQDKSKSSQVYNNLGNQGTAISKPASEHAGIAQINRAEECPPGLVKTSSRPRAPSGGTRPSRSRSITEAPSDDPSRTPTPRVLSGVSIGHQSGASQNPSAEVIASVNAIPNDECSSSMPRSSGTRVLSRNASATQSKRVTKSQSSVHQVNAAVNSGPDVGASNGVSPIQTSSQMQGNVPATALFIRAGEKCPPGYVLAPTGAPARGQTSVGNKAISGRNGDECPPGYAKLVPSQNQTPIAGPTEASSRTSQMKSNKEPAYARPGEGCPPDYGGMRPSQSQSAEAAPSREQSNTLQEQSSKAPVYVKPGAECPPGYERVLPAPPQTPLTGSIATQSSQMQNNTPGPTKSQSKTPQLHSNKKPIYVKPGEECPPGYERVVHSQRQTPLPGQSETQSKTSQIQNSKEPGEECPPGYEKVVVSQIQSSELGSTKALSNSSQVQSSKKLINVETVEECPPGYERVPSQSYTSLPGGKETLSKTSQMQIKKEPVYIKPGEECPPGYVRVVPSKSQFSEAEPTKALSMTSQLQNKKPVYVNPGEACPPGYIKAEPAQNQTSESLPTRLQSTNSQLQSNLDPVYVKPGEECPPGYVKFEPTRNQTSGTLPTQVQSKSSELQRDKSLNATPGEECPSGYVRSSPPESLAITAHVEEGVQDNAPIYIKEGEACPPGYVRATPAQNTSGKLVRSISQASKSKTSVINSPLYVRSGEECPPGYVKTAPTPNVANGQKVNQAATATTPVSPPNLLPLAGAVEVPDNELPVYIKSGEECPPGYVKAASSPAVLLSQPPTTRPSVTSQTQVKGNNTPKINQSVSAAHATPTTGSFNQNMDAATPVFVKSGEDCPPGYTKRPLPGQDPPPALPTKGTSPEATSKSQGQAETSVFVTPGEECPPGYINSDDVGGSPPQQSFTRVPLQSSPARAPLRASRDHKGEVQRSVEPPQTVNAQPGGACPPGNQKVGNTVTKVQPNERNKTFAIGANDQCPEGYVKICDNKNGPGQRTVGQTSEVQSGRKCAQQPSSSKSSSTKPRRGAGSPQTPGSKGGSDEQLSLGKRPVCGRSGSRGSRPKQGEMPEPCQGTNWEHSTASPNIQSPCARTSQRGYNEESRPTARAQNNQNVESNIELSKRSSERIRKSNMHRTSSSGRVAAEDEYDETETQPSRKSSGRSNVRKSDTIRSFTDEATIDNRSLSYDECPSRRSGHSIKGHETACRGLSCVDTIGDIAISERELMSEASSLVRRSRSRLEGSSSCRFQVEEGDKPRTYVKINEVPHRMDGSTGPSQQSMGRAVSSVKVGSLSEAVTNPPGDDQSEPLVSATDPITDDVPTEDALEEVPVESGIRPGEGDEQDIDPSVGSKPIKESGEGTQIEGDDLLSLREPAFSSIGPVDPPPEGKPVSEMTFPEEVAGRASPEEARADKLSVTSTTSQQPIVMAAGSSSALTKVAEELPVAREDSAWTFKYFQPPMEPQRRAPIPVFFNSLAVTPVVILPASMEPNSLKPKKSSKYGSKINLPCGGNAPCHGKARKLWEQEREKWVKEQTSKILLQETSNAFQALPEKVRSELAADAARRRKSDRSPLGPEYDIPDKRGWPFEPYLSKVPLMSPIDIMCECVVDRHLAPLTFEGHFFPPARSLITNTGESVEIRTVDPNCTPVLHGGPLLDDYIFESMHFHWSQGPGADCLGGTHRIDGRRRLCFPRDPSVPHYPQPLNTINAEFLRKIPNLWHGGKFCMEGHMIHFKSEFKSKAEALKHVGGICCVAFMLQIGGMENVYFGRMSQELNRISAPKSKAALDFNALQTFAGRACPFGYITYPGTLVGRDDPVNVIWIVYTEPIDICCQNVTQFQRLRPTSTSEIPSGCVPTLDVAKRPVLRACGPQF